MFKRKYKLEIADVEDDLYKVNISVKDTNSIEDIIKNTLPSYWRWAVEGRHPSRRAYSTKKNIQNYFNDYEIDFEYDETLDIYSFRIKLDDSPEGDTWVKGSFRIKPAWEIEIINKETYYN